jgi:hypothetical protein
MNPKEVAMSLATTHVTQASSNGVDHRPIGLGAVAVGLASLACANFASAGENGGVAAFAGTSAFMLAVAAIVFGLVVPRARESGRLVRPALILTVLSGLGAVAFWSGLAQIAAPAAVLLGYLALQREDTSRAGSWTAIVLSGLLYAAVLTASVIG